MTQQFQATYRDGALLPSGDIRLPLKEGETVDVTIQAATPTKEPDILKLLATVYEGLTPEEIDEIERIATDRSDFFTEPPANLP